MSQIKFRTNASGVLDADEQQRFDGLGYPETDYAISEEEWAKFGVFGLRHDQYILSGGAYFEPVDTPPKKSIKERLQGLWATVKAKLKKEKAKAFGGGSGKKKANKNAGRWN